LPLYAEGLFFVRSQWRWRRLVPVAWNGLLCLADVPFLLSGRGRAATFILVEFLPVTAALFIVLRLLA
jgi:hypothetical protein